MTARHHQTWKTRFCGGVLSMAAALQASGKKGPLVWQQPKLDHQRHFMLRFMQTSVPLVILNMRAKYPMREVNMCPPDNGLYDLNEHCCDNRVPEPGSETKLRPLNQPSPETRDE